MIHELDLVSWSRGKREWFEKRRSQDGENYGSLGSFISIHSRTNYEEFPTVVIS